MFIAQHGFDGAGSHDCVVVHFLFPFCFVIWYCLTTVFIIRYIDLNAILFMQRISKIPAK
nr:MAG TPA: hypothetical protein [Caudoviricetes sp.]